MKKGFTLIEMLIVVVVIAILMGMVVRFGNISTTASRRAETVSRLQRIENALSGYYAAFGTYPPVRLHGSRNIYLKVSSHGIQDTDGSENSALWGWLDSNGKVSNPAAEKAAWKQVSAACKSQPVACYYPYSENYREYVQAYSEACKSYVASLNVPDDIDADTKAVFEAGFDTGVPLGRFSSYRDKDRRQDREYDIDQNRLFKQAGGTPQTERQRTHLTSPDSSGRSGASSTGSSSRTPPCTYSARSSDPPSVVTRTASPLLDARTQISDCPSAPGMQRPASAPSFSS